MSLLNYFRTYLDQNIEQLIICYLYIVGLFTTYLSIIVVIQLRNRSRRTLRTNIVQPCLFEEPGRGTRLAAKLFVERTDKGVASERRLDKVAC